MPTGQPLSIFMRRLLTGYAVVYNRKYARSGHLFQNRYKSIICEQEPYFLELVRYIHLNPVRAGALSTVDELADYPWSGHAVIMGKRKFHQDIAAVLDRFGKSAGAARAGYLQFVNDGVGLGQQGKLTGGGLRRSQPDAEADDEIEPFDARILGGGEFVERIQEQVSNHALRSVKVPLPEIAQKLAAYLQVDQKILLRPSKEKKIAEARGVICYFAVREMGYKGTEVGRYLNLGPTGVTLAVRRGEKVAEEKHELIQCLKGNC
jgi:hypothetical protein